MKKKSSSKIIKVTSPTEASKEMKGLNSGPYGEGDIEIQHTEADKLLCRILVELGYKELVDEFNKIDKWYA